MQLIVANRYANTSILCESLCALLFVVRHCWVLLLICIFLSGIKDLVIKLIRDEERDRERERERCLRKRERKLLMRKRIAGQWNSIVDIFLADC